MNLKNINTRVLVLFLLSSGVLTAIFLFALNSATLNFPVNKVITIEPGQTFNEISQDFKNQNLIRSPLLFETMGRFFRKEKAVKAGEYFFEKKVGTLKLIKIITSNNYLNNLIRVTIPEGSTIKDIENIFKKLGFENFIIEDKNLEGYLFPDTYYVPKNISPKSLLQVMKDTFDKKTTPEMHEKEIVIMASLLEKEAATEEDRKLISGLLWKRLESGMLLQVDAIFPYIIGKNSFQLTLDDLKIDSPYNTYLYKGLPVGPIANPGLVSLDAALNPTESDYWYYLSDKESNIHYSVTYDEHLVKKERYLR